jgi:hypothetical protein
VDDHGVVHTLGVPRTVRQPALGKTLPIPPGSRLDLLGHRATGDTTRWWVLADANPWADATRLERPGTTIDLPDA